LRITKFLICERDDSASFRIDGTRALYHFRRHVLPSFQRLANDYSVLDQTVNSEIVEQEIKQVLHLAGKYQESPRTEERERMHRKLARLRTLDHTSLNESSLPQEPDQPEDPHGSMNVRLDRHE
jgi:hypothetical protein